MLKNLQVAIIAIFFIAPLFFFSHPIYSASPDIQAKVAPLKMIHITKGGGEGNGCGDPGAAVTANGSYVLLSGDDTDAGCGDEDAWIRFIKSDGSGMEPYIEGPWDTRPSHFDIVAANGLVGKTAMIAYTDWVKQGVLRIVSMEKNAFDTFDFTGTMHPAGIAMLNSGVHVAVIYEKSRSLFFYHAKDHKLIKKKSLRLPLKVIKTMVFDAKANALFVSGNFEDDRRGLIRLNINEKSENAKIKWSRSIDTKKGSAKLLLRRRSVRSEAIEVLLLSKSFYARIDAANGSLKHIETSSISWLPKGRAPQVAYDPKRDVILSSAGTKMRQHDIKNGRIEWELDFYHNTPKTWPVNVKDVNPKTDLSLYPPMCGKRDYPDHPEVPRGKWEDIDQRNDSLCSINNSCPYKAECSDEDICCVSNDCCILDSYFFANWRRRPHIKPEGVESKSIHVTDDGRIHVVLHYAGFIDDEESYYELWMATFKRETSESECKLEETKKGCQNAVTETGCFWKSAINSCLEATRCSKIKKSASACIGATKLHCAYAMKKEGKYICIENHNKCIIAKNEKACMRNGCLWNDSSKRCHD